jgi:transposase
MTHRRQFTAELKAQVVLALLSGAKRSAEVCREHPISSSGLADGKTIVLTRAASVFDNAESPSSQDASRVAGLARLLGRVTLENDILNKATSLLPTRSKRHGRESRCAAIPLLGARSAVSWGRLAAMIITARGPAMNRYGKRQSCVSPRPGRRLGIAASRPCGHAKAGRSTASPWRGACTRGGSKGKPPHGTSGRHRAPIPTHGTVIWCKD